MNRLAREIQVFRSCPAEMRVLMGANILFTLVLPVIDVFVAAFVMRNSHDAGKVVSFQLAIYTGIPIAFFAAGHLFGRIPIARLYAAGMVLTGCSMLVVMSSSVLTPVDVAFGGVLLGLTSGLFCATRVQLAIETTRDSNRNYYYGVEMFFYTLTSVLVPLGIGWLVEETPAHHWFGGERNTAYLVVAGLAFCVTAIAAAVVLTGRFREPLRERFVYLRFHPFWYRMIALAVLKGLAQGYIVTVPAVLILMLVGQEGILGTVQAAGGILAAAVLYAIGRLTLPRHRLRVFAAGLLLFLAGGLVDSVLFNTPGVLVLTFCLLASKPLLDVAYFPMQFLAIEVMCAIEGRSQFAYLFHHELAEYVGRLAGCGLFLVIAMCASQVAALKYALPVIGALQCGSLWIAKRLLARAGQMTELHAATGRPG